MPFSKQLLTLFLRRYTKLLFSERAQTFCALYNFTSVFKESFIETLKTPLGDIQITLLAIRVDTDKTRRNMKIIYFLIYRKLPIFIVPKFQTIVLPATNQAVGSKLESGTKSPIPLSSIFSAFFILR